MAVSEAESAFAKMSDDVVLTIFFKLEDDPRDWSRLACVCSKFSSLVRNACWTAKCSATIPSVVSDLFSPSSSSSSSSAAAAASTSAGGWAALHKLAVCCPGLLHAGVLLENSDFGLERELGPDESFPRPRPLPRHPSQSLKPQSRSSPPTNPNPDDGSEATSAPAPDCSWSLFDDLYFDTLYDDSETLIGDPRAAEGEDEAGKSKAKAGGSDFPICKRRKVCRSLRSHLASGKWNLCREQGNKLLASRFRGDCLYICDWPGCVHIEEKRKYMLFRGIFKNFKQSRVWRTISDANRSKIDLNCAFCACKETWDLYSSFCLRRGLGYHDDGEPVVRAYVCENGHVSGAWTDLPLYT